MGEAFTFVSHTCLHSVTLLVCASFFFAFCTHVASVCSQPKRRRRKRGVIATPPKSSRSRWVFFFTSYVCARTFFPPKKRLARGKWLHSVTLLVRARSFRFTVLRGIAFRLQSSGEEEEEKSTCCHDDSPVLFDFDDEDYDEDSYGMLVSLPLSYDAW